MSWEAVAGIGSMVSTLAVIIGVAFTYGSLTTTVKSHAETLDEHAKKIEGHGDRLNEHEVKLGRMQEWKDGFNAASRIKGSHEAQ